MAGFSVDTDAVKTFGQQMSQVCADLGSAVLPSDLSDGDAGNPDVAHALQEFHSHWSKEQDKLLDSLTKLVTTIRTAGEGYQQSDDAVSSGASGTTQ